MDETQDTIHPEPNYSLVMNLWNQTKHVSPNDLQKHALDTHFHITRKKYKVQPEKENSIRS